MIENVKILGIGGNAGAGKDELCKWSQKLLAMNGKASAKISIGDFIKSDLKEVIEKQFGFDITNCERWQKELVRGILVEYGKSKRTQSQGEYFTKKVEYIIKYLKANNPKLEYVIIPDIRYCDDKYTCDEVDWLKDSMNGVLTFVEKYYIINGKKIVTPPANSTEEYFHPMIKEQAHYIVEWQHVESEDYREAFANHILKQMKWI